MTQLSRLIFLFSALMMTAALPYPGFCVPGCVKLREDRECKCDRNWLSQAVRISRDDLGRCMARDPSASTTNSFVNNVARQAGGCK
ncbi:hypothetical protein BD779DRAFT_317425 [Infundibulicybe gibba]|nr:hypothetical protein BD779DRAFT_317425 [Infundibulicybe gibba]